MNTSGEAAEQVVKIMLDGSEVLIKLTGSGAKNVAAFLFSVFRQQKKTRGSVRMTNMLRSGKPLKVFTFRRKDLSTFRQTAGKYGIMYTVLKEKSDKDGVFDVMVRAEDESKLSRLIERYRLRTVDTAELRTELIKAKDAPPVETEEVEKSEEKKDEPSAVEPEKEEQNEPDIGDNDEEVSQPKKLSRAENTRQLKDVMAVDGKAKENPTMAKAEQDSLLETERKENGNQSKDNESKESIFESTNEKIKENQSQDESPFWPSSMKKKKQEGRISVLREIQKRRAERAAKQKENEVLPKEQLPKTTIKEKEGR